MAANFTATTLAVIADVNLIDPASRVQVFSNNYGRFYVAVPAHARNSGIRAVHGTDSLPEALTYAETITAHHTAKFNRLHTKALQINATR